MKSVHEIEYSNIHIDKSIGRWSKDIIYSELEDMFYQIYVHWYYNEYIIENDSKNPLLSQTYFMSYMNTIKYTKSHNIYDDYYNKATHILRKLKLEKLKNE